MFPQYGCDGPCKFDIYTLVFPVLEGGDNEFNHLQCTKIYYSSIIEVLLVFNAAASDGGLNFKHIPFYSDIPQKNGN